MRKKILDSNTDDIQNYVHEMVLFSAISGEHCTLVVFLVVGIDAAYFVRLSYRGG